MPARARRPPRPSPPWAATRRQQQPGRSGRPAGGRRARAARSAPPGRRGGQDGRDVHAVRMVPFGPGRRLGPVLVRADALGAPAEQGDRAAGVAPAGVGQPDRDLGQALPQIAVARRRRLPGRLEDLVRVERAAFAEQLIGEPGRVGPVIARSSGTRAWSASAAARSSGRPSASRGRAFRGRPAGSRSRVNARVPGRPASRAARCRGSPAVPRAGSGPRRR